MMHSVGNDFDNFIQIFTKIKSKLNIQSTFG